MLDPKILAFDTSGPHCAAALLRDDSVLNARVEDMSRGQAERIMVLLEDVLAEHGTAWSKLDAIAVGVGPGNFTGIRISVSAARGLALGLGIPAVPVSTFEIMRDPNGIAANAAELVVVAGPRDTAYVQSFRYGCPIAPPEIINPINPPDHLRRVNLCVTGHRAQDIAERLGAQVNETPNDSVIPERIARIAEWKLREGYDVFLRPAPLYVRPADAAPPREQPPKILP